MDHETRHKLLSRRGYRGWRVSQIGERRWVAETRLVGQWRVLCDEALRFRFFVTDDDALQAAEADRCAWEAFRQSFEEEQRNTHDTQPPRTR